jgi:ABC-type Fe3+/spermidine/putrescine transport system ATPase subunit
LSAYLVAEKATKQFATGLRGLDEASIAVEKGEFFTLLGPSGCGKTTLLRAIAGFHDLTSGSLSLGGKDLRAIPPHQRDIGMVFQDYAVFPHLSVFDNVAFGLKARKTPKAEIQKRVQTALEMVHLGSFADRMPAAMSGGQQQRIGIARAMVINPSLLLMDEPLSNLDAKLRVELREDIRDIQKAIDIAAIYVTHDQEEALAISDRICVMNGGRIEQIGTPQQIYGDPQTLFVARFVGIINTLQPGKDLDQLLNDLKLDTADAATWVVRPEHIKLVQNAKQFAPTLVGSVSKFTYLGREAHAQVTTALGSLTVHINDPGVSLNIAAGDTLTLSLSRSALMKFDAAGKRVKVEGL